MPKRRLPPPRELLRFKASLPSWHTVAQRHIGAGCPALALDVVRRELDRVPAGADRREAERLGAILEPVVAERAAELGGSGPADFEALLLHERSVEAMAAGRLDEAAELIRELLERVPDCQPALNNLSIIAWAEEQPDEAIGLARRVLDGNPENVNALANLTTFLLRRGRLAEAEEVATRLYEQEPVDVDSWIKVAEAASYLGHDDLVLGAYRQAMAIGQAIFDDFEPPEFLVHLAAVADHRQGRPAAAEALWRDLARRPGLGPTVRDNLADLRRPPGEREGPWSYAAPDWLGARFLQHFAQIRPSATLERADELLRALLVRNPGVSSLVPVLLDRGPPVARLLAMMLLDRDLIADSEVHAAAVRAFVLGDFGTDEERRSASRLAMRRGWMAGGQHRMWQNGAWQDVMLLGFEVHGEPTTPHPPQVVRWMMRASELQSAGRFDEAERLVRQALAAEPDAPDVQYNLAALRQVEGRNVEAVALVREIHARWPDYLFASCRLAETAAEAGRVAEARALLDPLLTRTSLHFSEFRALASAQIATELADGSLDTAARWLEMGEQIEPDHPVHAQNRRRVEQARRRAQ